MAKYTFEEIKEKVEQGIELFIRGFNHKADVCGFEMSTDWDGKNIFEFKVDINGEPFHLDDYMSHSYFDYYDLVKGNCSFILDEIASDIATYVAAELGVEVE